MDLVVDLAVIVIVISERGAWGVSAQDDAHAPRLWITITITARITITPRFKSTTSGTEPSLLAGSRGSALAAGGPFTQRRLAPQARRGG